MDSTQKDDFRQRRAAILKSHMDNDPKQRAARRRRKFSFGFGMVRYVMGIAAALFLIKTFTMAFYGPAPYAQLIAPALSGVETTHPLYQALMPDPVSAAISDSMQAFMPDRSATPVATAPLPSGAEDAANPPASIPES